MPPRLPFRLATITSTPVTTTSSIPSFLVPFLHTSPQPSQLQALSQSRHASILSELSDRPGAYNRRIRRGRGPASGKGGKSGRGSDGQKQHGKVPFGFNGGQTPEHIVHGKYGFQNVYVQESSSSSRCIEAFSCKPAILRPLHPHSCHVHVTLRFTIADKNSISDTLLSIHR